MGRSQYYRSPSKKQRSMCRFISFLKVKLNSALSAKPALSISPTQCTDILPNIPVLITSKMMSISIPPYSIQPPGAQPPGTQPPGARPPWPILSNRTPPSQRSPQPLVPSTQDSNLVDIAEQERQKNVQNTLDMIDEALRRLNCN